MKTRLYWTSQHLRRAWRELRFTLTCWWLGQQVEFLEWRVRLEALMPQASPVPVLVERRSRYVVHTL